MTAPLCGPIPRRHAPWQPAPLLLFPLPFPMFGDVRLRSLSAGLKRIVAMPRARPGHVAPKERRRSRAIPSSMDSSSRRTDGAPQQQRDFEETLAGLRDDFKPATALEESCVRTIAESYVKLAAVWRYENIAALKCHQERERETNRRIAAANPAQAAHLRAEREHLRRAGLWRPTIPGPREANAILRYQGSLNRTIHRAIFELQERKSPRIGWTSSRSIVQKQTHFSAPPRSGPEALRRASNGRMASAKTQKQTHYSESPDSSLEAPEELRTLLALLQKVQKQTHLEASQIDQEEPRIAPSSSNENVKANPLSSMFTGNRHQRRRAKALAARRR